MAIAERELKTKQAEILSSPEATDYEWTLEDYLEDRGVVLPTEPVTFEEYLEWSDQYDVRTEWVNGIIEVRMPANRWHQDIVGLLYILFRFYVKRNGGLVSFAPFVMRLQPGVKITKANKKGSAREPDIFFLAAENVSRMQETLLDGPADVIVEVISTESQRRDRHEKFFEYEKAGIREYWLIDPKVSEEEFYRRDEATGRFLRVPLENDRIYRSEAMPGLALDVTLLRQRPLPEPEEALRSAGLL